LQNSKMRNEYREGVKECWQNSNSKKGSKNLKQDSRNRWQNSEMGNIFREKVKECWQNSDSKKGSKNSQNCLRNSERSKNSKKELLAELRKNFKKNSKNCWQNSEMGKEFKERVTEFKDLPIS